MSSESHTTPMTNRVFAPWLIRLMLAVALLTGNEILIWNNPLARTPTEWALLLAGYLLLAAVMLDLLERWRIADLWGVFLLLGIYVLLNGLLLNPTVVLEEMPRTLILRGLGAGWLLGLEMFGLILALMNGQAFRTRRILLMACAAVGFNWGVWIAWFPVFNAWYGYVTPQVMALYLGVPVAVILLLFLLARRQTESLKAVDFILPQPLWIGIIGLLLIGFVGRLVNQTYTADRVLVVGVLLLLCLGGLWFRNRTRRRTVLEYHIPMQPMRLPWIIMGGIIFVGMTLLAMRLPLVELVGINQFSLVTLAFVGVGTIWLPFVALILSVRAVSRQFATGQV